MGGVCSGSNNIRCNGNSKGGGWERTENCMKELGNAKTCYCLSQIEYYVVANDNLSDFKECCRGFRTC